MRSLFTTYATFAATVLVTAAGGAMSDAHAVAPLPVEFEGVDVKNKLGEKVDINIPLTDPAGRTVTLANYLDGERPVLFTLNFYRCTSICSTQLNVIVEALAKMGWAPGPEKFKIVTVSFDPTDTVDIAAGKQDTYRRELVRQIAKANDDELDEATIRQQAEKVDWTFLVARKKSIDALLDNVGYSVRYDERRDEFAHSPVTYVLTPDGTINRYLWGFNDITPKNVKFGLMESSDGKLGSFGDKVLLSCFDYNRDHGTYEAFAWGFMRIGGIGVMLIFAAWLIVHWRREARKAAQIAKHVGGQPDSVGPSANSAALNGLGARSSPSESRP